MRLLKFIPVLALVIALASLSASASSNPGSSGEPIEGVEAWFVDGDQIHLFFGEVAGSEIHLFDIAGSCVASLHAADSYFEMAVPHAGMHPDGTWLHGLIGGDQVEFTSEHWDWGD